MTLRAVAQPVRYGSDKHAKDTALFAVVRHAAPVRYVAACFGNRSHYHRDSGICVHVEFQYRTMKAWHASRLWYAPFGDKDVDRVKVKEVVV